jgi:hypothetical protein
VNTSSEKGMKITNNSFSSSEPAPSDLPKCKICGRRFEDMAEMQRHVLTEHLQKGEIPEDQK